MDIRPQDDKDNNQINQNSYQNLIDKPGLSGINWIDKTIFINSSPLNGCAANAARTTWERRHENIWYCSDTHPSGTAGFAVASDSLVSRPPDPAWKSDEKTG